MDSLDVLWDRFAGGLKLYVENYLLKKSSGGLFAIQPSYEVDYEISDYIIDALEATFTTGNVNDVWYLHVSSCRNINELSNETKTLAIQFLPRFLEQYPQYNLMECLKVDE